MISWQEEDIEKYICENIGEFFGRDFFLIGRQVHVGVGVIDILTYDKVNRILYVVEIKNKKICNNALAQVMRYMVGVQDYLREDEQIFGKKIDDVQGILVGPGIENDTTFSLRLVDDMVEYVEFEVEMYVSGTPKWFERNKDIENYKPDPFIDLLLEKLIESMKTEEDDSVSAASETESEVNE